MRHTCGLLSTLTTIAVCLWPFAAAHAEKPDVPHRQLFYRMVCSQSNASILPKTKSVWTQDQRVRVSNTGMADEGYTEFPFCYGVMDFTFAEAYAIYPRLISGAQADVTRVNTADLIVDHVYASDGCVWGFSGREFVQTFTATQSELVSITLLAASEPGMFRAALLQDGPEGKQIGPAKTFTSGHSMTYGTARWKAGQAPLIPGRTYGIRMWREDGKPWTPYLHATGDAYDGGMLYIDGIPTPASDMAIQIVEEPDDLKQGLVPDADEEGWVYDTEEVVFVPRTKNVRMITASVSPVKMDPPTPHNCGDLVIRVFDEAGRLVAGPKRGVACGTVNGTLTGHVLFARDEFYVTPDQPYKVNIYMVQHKQEELPGDDDIPIVPRDIRLRVYGESDPGTLPGIYNLTAGFPEDGKLHLSWSCTLDAKTRIAIHGDGMKGAGNKLQHVDLKPGETESTIAVWPGHTYTFRMTATGPTGQVWRTPLYEVTMPRKDEIKGVKAWHDYEEFLPLAAPTWKRAPEYDPLRYERQIELVNPGFEEGLDGWTVMPAGSLQAPDVSWGSESREQKEFKLGTKWGNRMAGFTEVGGEKREQVFARHELTQAVVTVPGHKYVLSGWVHTSVSAGAPRGDTRVRLFADPSGGRDFERHHSSQWYWTDGEWIRFQHEFLATAERATVGFGFFRWRDLDRASAYVDNVTLYDLGPAGRGFGDPALRVEEVPALVLKDNRVEADDKIEAYLEAPPGYVITGLGSRAHYDNITTMWMRIRPLMPDGTLGEPEELRSGWESDSSLEAKVELPDGYVATGFGAGIAPEWDVKRFGVWARLLSPDGTLGEEKLFRGGIDLESGFERQVQLEPGRVLTGAGLNCMLNDVNGIKASSARLIPSATGAVRD